MQRFYPELFIAMSAALETVRRPDALKDSDSIPVHLKTSGIKAFAPLVENCTTLGLKASAKSVKKIVNLYSTEGSTFGQQRALALELQNRLLDEMTGEYFFFLTASGALRYDKWGDGWEKILDRFPDTVRDVEEMNKCFALSRFTAAMFHALHVAECGAIQLGDYIGVLDPKKGWGPTEKKLRELIKGGHANLPTSLKGKFEFLEQMNREIDSMVLAWRHKVDHAANHLAIVPNTDFTPDIAEHILGSVKLFMHRLLEGIPESTTNHV